MRSLLTVNSADAYRAACRAGLGIIQAPRFGVADALRDGTLVEILPEFTAAPIPVAWVHAYARAVPRRVRVFMDWVATVIEPHLDG